MLNIVLLHSYKLTFCSEKKFIRVRYQQQQKPMETYYAFARTNTVDERKRKTKQKREGNRLLPFGVPPCRARLSMSKRERGKGQTESRLLNRPRFSFFLSFSLSLSAIAKFSFFLFSLCFPAIRYLLYISILL